MDQLNFLDTPGLLEEISEYRSQLEIVNSLALDNEIFERWKRGEAQPNPHYQKALVQYCLRHDLMDVLEYYVSGLPSYNPYSSFQFDTLPLGYGRPIGPTQALRILSTKIAGKSVGFPIGVPASILTGTSRWIEFYAKRGFDILTYKTVRTLEWDVYDKPNVGFIPETHHLKTRSDFNKKLFADPDFIPYNSNEITAANSFGIPSLSPKEWQEDISRAKSVLGSGKILIVSVTGTTLLNNDSFEYLVNDFVKAASMAREAGADAIELNLSCPNVKGHHEGDLYLYPEETKQVVQAVWEKAINKGETPLLVKIGYLESSLLRQLVKEISSYVAGIVAINTIAAPIYDKHTLEQFFPPDKKRDNDRIWAGVSGSAIREFAKEVVRNLVVLREKEHYEFDVLAVGGVSNSQHVQDYLNLGANGVLSCTGALVNPNLALETRQQIGEYPRNDKIIHDTDRDKKEWEVNIMKDKEKDPKEGRIPDIEPGYGRYKPRPLSGSKDSEEKNKSLATILRELLQPSKVPAQNEKKDK